MLQCDWCHKPITGKAANGWAFQLELIPFHALAFEGGVTKDKPRRVALGAHLHARPCKDELSWAIARLLNGREPLETDGPSDDDEVEGQHAHARESERGDRAEREAAWERIPAAERERLLLHVLAGDHLTLREITERLQSELADCRLYESHARRLVMALHKSRELDRRPDPRKRGSVRYLYFARRELDGPIADLERRFHESDSHGGEA